jgi:kinetochore protein Mis12/MTW1
MKTLLSELRPALHTMSSTQPQVRDPNLVEQDGDKSWRLQRLQYIESQTRRLHENVRGLELGPKGEVRDGEWQERGRRVGRAEVENLERVLGIVGNGNPEGQAEGQGEEMDES